MNGSISILNLQ